MARPGVTEKQVFEAIQALMAIDAKVTVESIRMELGHGSPNTINRHLRAWRQKPIVPIANPVEVKQLKRRCADLEAELKVSLSQAERLSSLILERDRTIVALEKVLQEKEEEKGQLTKTLEASQQALEKMQAVQEASALERQILLESLTEAQREQAVQFREDLKAVNEMSLNQVRKISMSSQDRWLEEKIKIRELQTEIERLIALNKHLEEKILNLHTAQAPLKKRIADQEKIIAHCLDPKKMESFKEEGET